MDKIKKMLEKIGAALDQKIDEVKHGPMKVATSAKKVRPANRQNHSKGTSRKQHKMAAASNRINRKHFKHWKH
jgi:hypothetical protein